jgi:hypothetical protein
VPPATITSASSKRHQTGRIADGVGARRAGGDDRVVGALEAVLDGDIAAGQVDQTTGNEERAETARPFLMHGHACLSAMPFSPPIPEPIRTPVRV